MNLFTGFMNFLRKRITFRFEVSTAVRGNHFTEPRRNAKQRNAIRPVVEYKCDIILKGNIPLYFINH